MKDLQSQLEASLVQLNEAIADCERRERESADAQDRAEVRMLREVQSHGTGCAPVDAQLSGMLVRLVTPESMEYETNYIRLDAQPQWPSPTGETRIYFQPQQSSIRVPVSDCSPALQTLYAEYSQRIHLNWDKKTLVRVQQSVNTLLGNLSGSSVVSLVEEILNKR